MYEDVFIAIWVEHECCKMFKQPTNCTLEETSPCVTDTVITVRLTFLTQSVHET